MAQFQVGRLSHLLLVPFRRQSLPAQLPDYRNVSMRGVKQDAKGPDYNHDPFFLRVVSITKRWIATEWSDREAIRRAAVASGWTEQSRCHYDAAALTVENLAQRLDNISIRKLRRELSKMGAPSPGAIIRAARIDYAKHLLVTTRLLIREVRQRAGYDSEKHFAEQFQRATGVTPSAYRRYGSGSSTSR